MPNEEPVGQMRNFGNGLTMQPYERGWRQITPRTCLLEYGSFASRFHAGISRKVTFFSATSPSFPVPSCHWNSSDVRPLLADFLIIVWGKKASNNSLTSEQNHAETNLSIKEKQLLQTKVSALPIINENIYWVYALENLIYDMSSD